MLGNVFQWVNDCWTEDYAAAPTNAAAVTDGGDCIFRGWRGGSWYSKARIVRSAYRSRNWTGVKISYLGFRVARSL